MADYHYVYKDVDGASTQWDDIQRRLGNLPPKPAAFKPPPFVPADDPTAATKSKDWLDERTPDELDDLEDDPSLDDDRFLQDYRKKRLEELKAAARVPRFGSVVQISGSDFIREVSQAPKDVWVVVLLYKDAVPTCQLLLNSLEELATRYPMTKFVKIISTDCIPNYPDVNLPTVLVYNNGAVKRKFVGLLEFGGRSCTPEAVALALCESDPVLNDGQSGSDPSQDAVRDGVRRRFLERFVKEREEKDGDGYSSD